MVLCRSCRAALVTGVAAAFLAVEVRHQSRYIALAAAQYGVSRRTFRRWLVRGGFRWSRGPGGGRFIFSP